MITDRFGNPPEWPGTKFVKQTSAGTKYLTEPHCTIIAATYVTPNTVGAFLHDLGCNEYLEDERIESSNGLADGAHLLKFAGQLCYLSFTPQRTRNAQASEYLRHIKESAHGSVFEHVNYTILFWGVSRAFTHELVRHRAGFGFSQVSQRYVSSKHLRFVESLATQFDRSTGTKSCPCCDGTGQARTDGGLGYYPNCSHCDGNKMVVEYDILTEEGRAFARQRGQQAELHYGFERWIDASKAEYERRERLLLELAGIDYGTATTDQRKTVRQEARRCLPNETEAPIVVTGNGRAWRHLIEQRASKFADAEACRVAFLAFETLRRHEAILWEDYEVETVREDGLPTVKTPYRKI